MIFDVFLTCSSEERTTTGKSPIDATKEKHALKVRVELLEISKNKVLNVGDEVKTYNKGRGIAVKSFARNKRSDGMYKVSDVVYEKETIN